LAAFLYFGRLMDVAGGHREARTLPASVRDTMSLRAWLDEVHAAPGVFSDPAVRFAINDEIVADAGELADTDEIAVMPPVGGG
jgi:molybdopterin converting factor small subunit